jgi:hypothetical protein
MTIILQSPNSHPQASNQPVLRLPRLRPDQWAIASHPAKTKVIANGRRWGKTLMAGSIIVAACNAGAKAAWVVPSYKNARPVWRFAQGAVEPLKKYKLVDVNKTEKTIFFPRTKGWLGIYSGDNDVALRGEDFDLVVVEEAAQIGADTFYDVILPTLADRNGMCYLISTPLGRNWFWREFIAAQACYFEAIESNTGLTDRMWWTAPSSANPNPKIQRAAELAKDRVSESTYRQEWMAEFLEGEGSVFSRVNLIASLPNKPVKPYYGRFVGGLDLAQKKDYTVLVVLDAETRKQVDILRVNKKPWLAIRALIKEMCDKWKIEIVLGEHNSIGGPNIEALQDDKVPIVPFETTSSSKAPLIESLVLAFERDEIRLFNDPNLTLEFEAYEKTISPLTGRVYYAAPKATGGSDEDEIHDDIVMATALAWKAITTQGFGTLDDDLLDLINSNYR